MYCLPLLIAFCLAQTECLSINSPSITSRATELPPDYTEALPPKRFLQKYRSNRRMLLGSDGGGDDKKAGTESLEDSFDHQMFRRRNKDDTWKWDTYCQLQPQYGSNCDKPQKKYYYDRQLDSCLPFQYTGCKKNKNNFNNLWECEGYCKGAAYSNVVQKNLDAKIICALQTDAGRCLAYFQSYFFDINTGTCKKFGFGGCGGNENQFKTQSACNKLCKHTLREEAEYDEDSEETDLSSDYDEPIDIKATTLQSTVKRPKKKKYEGNKSGLNKSKAIGDISKSNEGFMAKSKKGTSIDNVRFSEQSNTMKNNKVNNAENNHEGFVTTKSAPKNDDDSTSVRTFSGSVEKNGTGKDVTAKSRSREVLDRIIKESDAKKTTSKNDGDSMSISTFSGSEEKNGKGKDVKAKSRSREVLDRIIKESEATKTTPENDGDSKSIITFSGSEEKNGKLEDVTAKSRSKEAFDRIIKDFEATKTTPENESDETSVFTFSAAQTDLEKNNENTAANAISGSNEVLDKLAARETVKSPHPQQEADPNLVIIHSHSAEIVSGNPNITISIQNDPDESSAMSVLSASDIQI